MSNFPTSFDDDVTLPVVNDNINEIGADAINALRDVAFALEQNIGLGAAGTAGSIASRLDVFSMPDGSIRSSALTSLGLVTLPITNDQISNTAAIPESKLKLDYRTSDLFNYINNLAGGVNTSLGWIATSGIKLEPHILGALYRHTTAQIDVSVDPINFPFLLNRFHLSRNNDNAYTLFNDINNEFLQHQWSDSTPEGAISNIITTGGSTYPSNYGHTASGIYLNTSRFVTVPQTAQDLQLFAEFIDSSSVFLLGTRIQNLYSNGISRVSRSSSLVTDGYGPPLVPVTTVTTFLLNNGTSGAPIDDINIGDDIIEFKPSAGDMANNSFDEKFALVKVGDIVRVNYGTVEVQFLIKEKKYIQSGGNKKYIVRIAGKNLFYRTTAVARIDKPLFNNQKPGVLSLSAANNPIAGSLIVGAPRGAQVTGVGFNPDQFDNTHYMLYLVIYPTGNPVDGFTILPGIDVTGNQGSTPGVYSLESIIQTTNNAFRQTGYNYRFTAFQHQGEFGIMLADSYGNTGFSIISGEVDSVGLYDQTSTETNYPNNVVGLFAASTFVPSEPLGFGPSHGNIASPKFRISYSSAEQALLPTKLFLPLKRNNYYINGVEKESLELEVDQILDTYGDGYWVATVQAKNVFPSPGGRVQTTYRIPLDLSTSGLKAGKTIVVQSLGQGTLVDFGRFVIESVTYYIDCILQVFYTDIVVYDAVHAIGLSPSTTIALNSTVAVYFNSDSVSFNSESATDFSPVTPFKRFFEVYINQEGETFSHERARINNSGSTILVNSTIPLYTFLELTKLNIVKVSPKLRGYQFGAIAKITLKIVDFNATTGIYSGFLAFYDGSTLSHKGTLVSGKKGQITRFYDETNIDYIDILFDLNVAVTSFSDQVIDFQLFPSLAQDSEVMLIGNCQYNDINKVVNYIKDERQFGNTSEKDLSTSALNYLSIPEKYLHANGVIRGFDILDFSEPNAGQLYFMGGLVLVNGNFIQMNQETVVVPIIKESYTTLFNVNWLLCVNDKGEYVLLPLLDYDGSVPTPNAPTRMFTAFNLVSGTTYSIDATTFSDVINNRKDLTVLYIVKSFTSAGTPPTITLTLTDARRYVTDVDNNIPLKLTSANSQGSFKSLASVLNWIRFNNDFNNIAIVKGADATTGVVNSPVILDFSNQVTIDGQNAALLTFNELVTFGSNLTIKNAAVVLNGGMSVLNNSHHVTFENCIISITLAVTGPPPLNVAFNFIGGNLITFTDCIVTTDFISQYDGAEDDRGASFRLTNVTNFKMERCLVTTTYAIQAGVTTPGNVFDLITSPGVEINDCIFVGNFNKLINNTDSNALRFTRSIVTSTYNPNDGVADTYATVVYDPTNLVNSGQGYIYANVTTQLDRILIDNVIFNYAPVTSNSDRYSFINIELSTGNAVCSNLTITNCSFNHLNFGGAVEDYRPMVAIINKAPAAAANSAQPILLNAQISNNVGNRNQMILMTSTLINSFMAFPGLYAIDCSISNNTCGTIGYWISSGYSVNNTSPFYNIFTDKTSGLSIENNVCHYISNLDEKGKYFLVSRPDAGTTTNFSDYPSGFVTINKNRANWIHVGISREDNSSLTITKNDLVAYNLLYTATYNDTFAAVGISSGYAIFVSSYKFDSHVVHFAANATNDSSVVIADNSTHVGQWLLLDQSNFNYFYPFGYIYCQSSNIITGNTCRGVDGSAAGIAALILISGQHNNITSNRLYRDAYDIFAYVSFGNFEVPTPWDGSGSSGVVTDNFFDSPTVNGIVDIAPVIHLDVGCKKWVTKNNINQSKFTQVTHLESLSGLIHSHDTAMESFFINGANNILAPIPFVFVRTGQAQASPVSIPTSYPLDPQAYRKVFALNNTIPHSSGHVYSIAVLFQNPFGGPTITFADGYGGDNAIYLAIKNVDTGVVFEAGDNVNSAIHMNSVLGTGGSSHLVQINTARDASYDPLDFPLDSHLVVEFSFSFRMISATDSDIQIYPIGVISIW
jgi:hypothetical protein